MTTPVSADTIFSVTDLGTLGGPNSAGYGINSSGVVTGWADPNIGGTAYAFTWTAPGPMQSLGTLPGASASHGYSINDSSWVCGESGGEAFLYTPQTGIHDLGDLPGGESNSSTAYSLNNAGVVVGGAMTIGGSYSHAFIWDATNGMRDLNKMIVNPPAGWTPTAAIAISQNGLIAGIGFANISTSPPSGAEHAFVLNGGTLGQIPSPAGSIYPEAINASGLVVGSYNGSRAFEYSALLGTRDIGSLGGAYTDASGENDLGQIVGGTTLPDGSPAAFVYSDAGGMVDLNALAPVNGWTLGTAIAINNNGQILASGFNANQNNHAFLLTPTPEPSAFGLLIIFACFVLISQLCRRRLTRL
jgi:probable HAF family extracellular repeat protein